MASRLSRRLQNSIEKNIAIRNAIVETKAAELARIFVQAEDQLFRRLLGEGRPITPERVEGIMEDIDRIVQEELTINGTTWVSSETPELYNLGISTSARSTAAQFGVRAFDQVPSERVRQTYLNFTNTPSYEGVVDSGFRTWVAQLQDTESDMVNTIRDVLTEGAITGASNNAMVAELVKDGKFHGIRKADGTLMSAELRARTIVRTEGIRAINQAEIVVSSEAGFRAYIDVGVKDDRTAGICIVAQRQLPHTLEWWRKSPLGLAPRHVANCRDDMMAILLEQFTTADARAFGIKGFDRKTFQLDNGKVAPGEARRLKKEIAEANKSQSRLARTGGFL